MNVQKVRDLLLEIFAELDSHTVKREVEWLTTAEASELCKVDRSTLTRLASTNQIPAKRIGKQWRFRREDIEGFDR
jgi:excisionase family DNA binding protein